MTTEVLQAKEDLRKLIDAYASLGDEKRLSEQMCLFTSDANYRVYMNGALVVDIAGTATLEKEFSGHAAKVKTYFTLNGQHAVTVSGNTATGISFSQIKMIRDSEGESTITDYSVRYDDDYVRIDGNWFIQNRTGHFLIIEARPLAS